MTSTTKNVIATEIWEALGMLQQCLAGGRVEVQHRGCHQDQAKLQRHLLTPTPQTRAGNEPSRSLKLLTLLSYLRHFAKQVLFQNIIRTIK